ncbi:MAG: type II secretion system F family protein [Humidesulfovibrio sp.]|uniref:type II secretion system F family protein n=1 Tax=Humidesulfovibrio sp. TaxID=2910988 RepID=UPI002736DC81|nr:type II secretion system F family protein [Humidesulfovibrio sp.]MDP2848228.1 type II secretion system F family protein [Humidesulfovibrio sp.]
MPFFKYTAMTGTGGNTKGVVEAMSADAAQDILAQRGLIPTGVSETSGPDGTSGGNFLTELSNRMQSIKPQDLILFTKQMRTMLNAGIPVLQSLDVLQNQTENPRLKGAIVSIGADIKSGGTLSRAFAKHPGIFPELYCNMIRAGEISGTLTDVLERLIYIVDHEFKVKKDIKSALTYPIVVVVALVAAFFILILFVLPQFVDLFSKAGIALPLPTRICLGLYDLLTRFWYIALAIIGGTVFGLSAYFRTEQGKIARDGFLLKLPILGPVFQKAAMARFASIFAILQASGITVLEAMDILTGTIGNAFIARDFRNLREKLEQGRGLSGPLRTTKSFTPMMVSMITIGEETGNMEEMLKEAARHYDYEVEYAVSKMSDLLGPVLVAGLTGVVGFFAMAIFLPLVELMQNSMKGM